MEAQAQEIESLIPRSRTREEALNNAIRATELYMEAAKFAISDIKRARLRVKCKKLLSWAEDIKHSETWSPSPSKSPKNTLKAPLSVRILSKTEKLILLEGSRLHGFIFPPWTSEPKLTDFDLAENGIYYTESVNLKLSDTQKSIFAGWIRPEEDLDKSTHIHHTAFMQSEKNVDLVQDITTNCSVVASLCALISRAAKGHDMLLSSVLYPYDKVEDRPMLSKAGKYVFCFQFNGCFRKVIIDSRLPTSTTRRSLHVIDRSNPRLLWPALVEKAYLKVRGGYDFPGSNSGTDLWVISGWIPEQVFLQSDEVQTEQLWPRIYKAFGFGDLMITLGTGRFSPTEEDQIGLVGEHDYAILDIRESASQRLLLIKNPWRNATIWKGTQVFPSMLDTATSEETLSEDVETSSSSTSLPHGAFWMKFETVIQYFQSMYLSWNPGLFHHRQDYHFTWTIPQNKNSKSLIENPQFCLRSSNKETVWILLSRHFSTEEQTLSLLPHETQTKSSSPLGFISLYIFDAKGHKVYLSDDAIHRGAFVDSPQTLAQLDVLPSKAYSLVVAQQELPLFKYSFTLSCFSQYSLTIDKALDRLSYHSVLNGIWNLRTSGGNANCSSYAVNPQYSIFIPSRADLVLMLEADQQDLAVHVQLLWGCGDRVTNVASKDIVVDSGEYRHGYAFASILGVIAGKYTIVCSTFRSGQLGNFTLRVDSSVACEVKALLSENAGRLSLLLEPLIFVGSVKKMRVPLAITRLTKLMLVLTAKISGIARYCSETSTPSRPMLRISIETIHDSNKTILGISGDGEFSDASMGIRLKDLFLTPQKGPHNLWIVVERSSAKSYAGSIDVEVLSDYFVSVGPWHAYDG
ncbi:Calpain-like protease [Podosphaera aphanis]|nr:Calpain-like protease [Podosphaera aphanis]